MDARTLLAELHRAGLSLAADGDRLLVEADGPITDRQRAAIRTHKPELLKLLAATAQAQTQKHRLADVDAPNHPVSRLFVTLQTPAGGVVTIQADSLEHAEQLKRWNPATEPITQA